MADLLLSVGFDQSQIDKDVGKMTSKLMRETRELEKQKKLRQDLLDKSKQLQYQMDLIAKNGGTNSSEYRKMARSMAELDEQVEAVETRMSFLYDDSAKLKANIDRARMNPESYAKSQGYIKAAADESDRIKSNIASANKTAREASEQSKKNKRDLSEASDSCQKIQSTAKSTASLFDKFSRRANKLIKNVFIYSVILRALRKISSVVGDLVEKDEELSKSTAKIKGNLLMAASPLWESLKPALQELLQIGVELSALLAKIINSFLGNTAEEAEKSAKSLQKMAYASKEAKKQLAGFDTLDILNNTDTNKSTDPIFENWDNLDLSRAKLILEIAAVLLLLHWMKKLASTTGLLDKLFGKKNRTLENQTRDTQAEADAVSVLEGALELAGVGALSFSDILSKLGSASIDNLPDSISDALNSISGYFGKSEEDIGKSVDGVTDSIEEGLKSIDGSLGTAKENFGQSIDDTKVKIDDSISAATNLPEKISNSILQPITEKLTDFAGNTVPNWYKSILFSIGTDFLPRLNSNLSGAFDSALSSVKDKLTEFTNNTLPNWYADSLSPALDDLYSAINHKHESWYKTFNSIGETSAESGYVAENSDTTVQDINDRVVDELTFLFGIYAAKEGAIKWETDIYNHDNSDELLGSIGDSFGDAWKYLKHAFSAVGSLIGLPALATGAVIPANRPFLAMLGDQTSGTNVEAPLSTIKQAVAEVLSSYGGGFGGGTIVLELDGRSFARAAVPAINKENARLSVKAVNK